MGNLIKYELKGKSKYILGAVVLIVLFNVYLIFKGRINASEGISKASFSFGLSSLCIIVSMVVAFAQLAGSFRRDITGDTAYLLFTLPQSGYSILGSKMIIALIDFVIFSVVPTTMFILNAVFIVPLIPGSKDILTELTKAAWINKGAIISNYLILALIFTQILLLMYFSLVVSKSILKQRKYRKLLSFIIFILTIIVVAKIGGLITNVFPQTINLGKVGFRPPVETMMSYRFDSDINIASMIYEIFIYIMLFIGTGYLMEEKMDL